MKHKTFIIKPWYELIADCRPPRKGEGIEWVDIEPSIKRGTKLLGGYKCPQIWGESCMGGNRFKNPLTTEQNDIAIQEMKTAIDELISSVMQSCNVDEKSAIKLLKET